LIVWHDLLHGLICIVAWVSLFVYMRTVFLFCFVKKFLELICTVGSVSIHSRSSLSAVLLCASFWCLLVSIGMVVGYHEICSFSWFTCVVLVSTTVELNVVYVTVLDLYLISQKALGNGKKENRVKELWLLVCSNSYLQGLLSWNCCILVLNCFSSVLCFVILFPLSLKFFCMGLFWFSTFIVPLRAFKSEDRKNSRKSFHFVCRL